MLSETILEMSYYKQNSGKNKIDILPFLLDVGPNFHIWASWPKIKKVRISSVLLAFLIVNDTIFKMVKV